jgi:outer membrane immunogenic protein
MNRIVVAATAALALASSAYAADFNAPTPTWTGLYFGANGGYATGDQKGQLYSSPCPTGCALTPDTANFPHQSSVGINGGFGGGQIGYNWQIGHLVTGLETDFDFGSIKGSGTFDGVNSGGWEWDKQLDAKVDWFGTVRGRLGYDINGFLPYLTGGLAYGHDSMDETVTQHCPCGPGPASDYVSGRGSFDETRFGWTAGAGFEYALTNHWSLKAEYLHIDLGNKTSRFVGNIFNSSGVSQGAWGQDGINSKVNLDTVDAGVNYKF